MLYSSLSLPMIALLESINLSLATLFKYLLNMLA